MRENPACLSLSLLPGSLVNYCWREGPREIYSGSVTIIVCGHWRVVWFVYTENLYEVLIT